MREQIHIRVRGIVQGVGFRMATHRTAASLGLVGWVRNCENGEVELIAEGETEKIQKLATWCQQGPPASRVEQVTVLTRQTVTTLTFSEFQIRR